MKEYLFKLFFREKSEYIIHLRRELISLALESIQREKELAKLEAEINYLRSRR